MLERLCVALSLAHLCYVPRYPSADGSAHGLVDAYASSCLASRVLVTCPQHCPSHAIHRWASGGFVAVERLAPCPPPPPSITGRGEWHGRLRGFVPCLARTLLRVLSTTPARHFDGCAHGLVDANASSRVVRPVPRANVPPSSIDGGAVVLHRNQFLVRLSA